LTRSEELLQRAEKVTPVASQTYSKSHRYFCGPHAPKFLEHGKGGSVQDVEGRTFLDFILGLGPITLGYNYPEINDAIIAQLSKGITFSQSTELEVELAEKLVEVIPCAEMVRFVKNGSDATTGAIRLARAFTGRDHVALCGYHGMHDWSIGTTPLCDGVPDAVKALSHVFEYGNMDSIDRIFKKHPKEISAVILEPIQGESSDKNFLIQLKERCQQEGALLIFDEVISGFRVALGGAQELLGITPDLASIGKGMANGMPLSAIVGRRDVLEKISDGVFISTTFGGECLSIAAALKTIEVLERPESFSHIWSISEAWKKGAHALQQKLKLDHSIQLLGEAPHCGFQFLPHKNHSPMDRMSVYQSKLIQEGFLTVGINNFCLSHSLEDVQAYLSALEKALQDVVALDDGLLEVPHPPIQPVFKR
jgi:glutamate-1-semialdehyde 2,1-aminomutase